ncbi:hypothetical protein T10_11757 [Trichinella papuae]|uniref:Uncharacterized protein n=1 Tax=Trichinella papuae TaxID=268474 RepID=A0A0V1M042_9BILA|nr:hypothetical protein T10_11757 [Trichinella papuae]
MGGKWIKIDLPKTKKYCTRGEFQVWSSPVY